MLPSGTVTFLFTDVVGSTARWEADPPAMRIALAEHNTILEAVVSEFGGHLFKTVGDAFCVAFSQPEEALAAASRVHAQLALASNPLQVRIGIHTGQISPTGNDYFGPPVNKVARIQSVANGGQTLFSDATRGLMPAKLVCKDLGSHSLKDLLEPTRLWQLGHEDFAELKSLSSIPNNLPIQSTSFVGRNEEMSQIGGLLEKSRLVTLTGTGGTGKSRLSIQVAAEHLNQFPDGIWFCEFAPIADREDVLPILATCLDLPASPDGLRERLLGHLKSKKSLLILDNCEHVLDSVSQLAEQILGQCPTVTLLVTSREPLGSRGETTFRVPSLALPASNERVPIEMLEEFGSTALFLERLATAAPSYRLETQDSPRIAQICRRLDGIPLAIELAAARARAMTLDQIEKKLDDRFRLLTGGSRNALSRQQTLRALIDWSFRLLNEWERAFFVSLAVFTGGWDLAAAETICSQGLEDVDEFEVIDLLTALVDKSLVVFDQRTGHYHLLESLRQYGLEQLELVPWALTLRDRHGEYFCQLAKEYATAGPDASPDHINRFWMYLEDYRAAVEWLSGRDELFSLAFNSFIHVNHGFYMMNRSAEYVRILLPLLEQAKEREEEMIEKAEIALLSAATTSRHPLAGQIRAEMSAGFDDRPPDLQTRWLGHLGYSIFFSGEFDESIRFLESYVNRPENPIETGGAFNTLGNAYTMIGQYKKAEAYFDRSIALPGNPASKSLTRATAGFPCLLDGRLKDALQQCLATIRFIDKNGVRIDGFYFATFPFWIPFTRLALDVGDLEFVAQIVASKKRRENLWNQNDPFDDLMDSYFYEAVADKVAPELVERHQKLWTRGQMQPWLESLLDLSVDDFYGDHPHIPNGHLLPWNNG